MRSLASTTDAAFQVDEYSGKLHRTDTDFSLATNSLPFVMHRTWRVTTATEGAFGRGWTSVFDEILIDRSLIPGSSAAGFLWQTSDGSLHTFQYEAATRQYITPTTLPGSTLTAVNGTNSLRLTMKDGATRNFERLPSAGQQRAWLSLTSVLDRHQNQIRFQYIPGTSMVSSVLMSGRTTPESTLISVTWTSGRVSVITDHAGRRWAYDYSSIGGAPQLRSVDGAVAAQTAIVPADRMFFYTWVNADLGNPSSDRYLLKSARSRDSGLTSYEYHLNGQLLSSDSEASGKTRYRYHEGIGATVVLDERGGVTRSFYSPDGTLRLKEEPGGFVTVNQWDHSRGLLLSSGRTDSGTTTWEYTATPQANLLATTDAKGLRTSYEYEPTYHQLLRTIIDPTPELPGSGDERTVLQNVFVTGVAGAEGNPVRTLDAAGNATTTTYTPEGKVSSLTTPRGNAVGSIPANFTTTFTYDVRGAVIQTVLPGISGSRPVRTSVADSLGRLLSSTDETGLRTVYSKNIHGDVVSSYVVDRVTGRAEISELFTWAAPGRLASRQSPDGSVHRYEYDNAGRLTREILPDGSVIRSFYSPDGSLESQIDAGGFRTGFRYDESGRRTQVITNDGVTEAVLHNAQNNPTVIQDARENQRVITYDNSGRIIQQQNPDGGSTRTTYDSYGNAVSQTDARGVITTSQYDSLNRIIRRHVGSILIETFQYDQNGNQTSTAAFDITGLAPASIPSVLTTLPAARKRTESIRFDERDRPIEWTDAAGQKRSVRMDA
ncbi:MAG: DUF6531 domain-containing protein, partial [Planctomyces sp.]